MYNDERERDVNDDDCGKSDDDHGTDDDDHDDGVSAGEKEAIDDDELRTQNIITQGLKFQVFAYS